MQKVTLEPSFVPAWRQTGFLPYPISLNSGAQFNKLSDELNSDECRWQAGEHCKRCTTIPQVIIYSIFFPTVHCRLQDVRCLNWLT